MVSLCGTKGKWQHGKNPWVATAVDGFVGTFRWFEVNIYVLIENIGVYIPL
jgi:hypothetical protein